MKLIQQANHVLDMYKTRTDNHEELVARMEQYLFCLSACDNPEEMEMVMQMNKELYLPPDLGIATYRRLLEFKRTPKLLREFAWYLQLYGPSWDDEAEELLKEADEMEGKSSGEAAT